MTLTDKNEIQNVFKDNFFSNQLLELQVIQ